MVHCSSEKNKTYYKKREKMNGPISRVIDSSDEFPISSNTQREIMCCSVMDAVFELFYPLLLDL